MVDAQDVATIEIEPDSDLAKALAVAGKTPIALVSNGQRYIVSRDPFHSLDDYDPEEFREALRKAATMFTPEEAEQLKKDIYRWREEGSRPMHMITATRAWDDPVWATLGAMPTVAETPMSDGPVAEGADPQSLDPK